MVPRLQTKLARSSAIHRTSKNYQFKFLNLIYGKPEK